jgi:hypothetical protein
MFVEEKAKGEGTVVNYGDPSISTLAYVLRHPELWPENFSWDYSSAPHCAMGLAHRMWPQQIGSMETHCVSQALKFSEQDACRIFIRGNPGFLGIRSRTEPAQIARALERVALKEARSPSTAWLRHPANLL